MFTLAGFTHIVCSQSDPSSDSPQEKAPQKVQFLNVAVLLSTVGHRGFLQDLATSYEAENPGVKLRFVGYTDTRYKATVDEWLSETGDIDVMYWQGGVRLNELIDAGKIHNIKDMWQQNGLSEAFPDNIVDVVAREDGVYGVPYAYYAWGMLYNKTVLDGLSLDVPQTWQELKAMCEVASEHQLFPIGLGGLEPWLPVAWFDYIDLRLNGLPFHQALLSGQVSFLDEKVTRVLEHWAELIEANCYNDNYKSLQWRNIMTSMYRKMTASTLIASFAGAQMPEQFRTDFVFKSFPVIDDKVPLYEEMPVDLFLISDNSKNKNEAEKFLLFMARADVQESVVNVMSQNSPHVEWFAPPGSISQQGQSVLREAKGLSQYFDRDMPQSMAEESLRLMNQFIETTDVESTQKALEDVRQRYLKELSGQAH